MPVSRPPAWRGSGLSEGDSCRCRRYYRHWQQRQEPLAHSPIRLCSHSRSAPCFPLMLPAAGKLTAVLVVLPAAGKCGRVETLYRTDKLEPYAEAQVLLQMAHTQAAQRARHLTHPQLCLDAIQYGVEHGGRAGLEKVRDQGFVGAKQTSACRPMEPRRGPWNSRFLVVPCPDADDLVSSWMNA